MKDEISKSPGIPSRKLVPSTPEIESPAHSSTDELVVPTSTESERFQIPLRRRRRRLSRYPGAGRSRLRGSGSRFSA